MTLVQAEAPAGAQDVALGLSGHPRIRVYRVGSAGHTDPQD